jgi:2-oxoisovalerate dehydrogenase E1 component
MSNPDALRISRELSLQLLEHMIRIRRFEDKCAELYTQEKIRGFLHLYDGEEGIAAGVIPALADNDAIVATYREHGHALVRGVPMTSIMAEMLGKVDGCSRGRGGSMHLFHAPTRFYGGNAIVGGGLPMAVGLALAAKMQASDEVIVCFFGEGAVAEGEFHESLNLAQLWQLPVLFVCENNGYAMGTALERSESQADLVKKAASYEVRADSVDGMDVIAVTLAARAALNHIRAGNGPVFLECKTYRFRAHSMFDTQKYRDKSEVAQWREKGPIVRFQKWVLDSHVVHDSDITAMEERIAAEIEAAVQFAEASPLEPLDDLLKHVYAGELA